MTMPEQSPVAEPVGWKELEVEQKKAIDRIFAAKSKGVGVRLSASEVHALCVGILGNCAQE